MDDDAIIEDDIEEEPMNEPQHMRDWPRFQAWYLQQYPQDATLLENINDSYRFTTDDREQDSLLCAWRLGGRSGQ
jgi:hypothetical protein